MGFDTEYYEGTIEMPKSFKLEETATGSSHLVRWIFIYIYINSDHPPVIFSGLGNSGRSISLVDCLIPIGNHRGDSLIVWGTMFSPALGLLIVSRGSQSAIFEAFSQIISTLFLRLTFQENVLCFKMTASLSTKGAEKTYFFFISKL